MNPSVLLALVVSVTPGAKADVIETEPAPLIRPIEDAQSNGIFHGVGVVTAIEPGSGAMTIDHGEIKGFMSAMEMTYNVKSPDLARGISVGDKVGFDIEGGSSSIVRVEKLENRK